MRPAKVTEEVVVETGIELERKQISINGWSLRNAIGAGKPERLEKIWLSYKSKDSPKLVQSTTGDDYILPLEIEESLTLFSNKLSIDLRNIITNSDTLANQIADQKAKSIYKSLEENNQNIESQLKIATSMIDDADKEIEMLKSSLILQKSIESKFIALDKEFAKQTIKIDGLNNVLDERQKLVEEKSSQLKELESRHEKKIIYVNNAKKLLTSEKLKELEELSCK
jgi:uncharacterized coiled-coil protein SlyX